MNSKLKAILATVAVMVTVLAVAGLVLYVTILIPEEWILEHGAKVAGSIALLLCIYLVYQGMYSYYRVKELKKNKTIPPGPRSTLTEEEKQRLEGVWRAPNR